MKRIVILISAILLAFTLAACGNEDSVAKETTVTTATTAHTHVFSDATCTEPPKCDCGEINGEALGHTWVEASCTAPKTCSVCAVTEGDVVHPFVNGICPLCKMTKIGLKLDSYYYIIGDGRIDIKIFGSDGYVGYRAPYDSTQSEWTTDKCIYYKGKPYYELTGIGGPAIAKFVVTDTEILVYNYSMSDGSLKNLSFKMSVNENGNLVITYSDSEYYKVGEVWLASLD